MLGDENFKIKLKYLYVFPGCGVGRALTLHAKETKNVRFAALQNRVSTPLKPSLPSASQLIDRHDNDQ